MHKILLATLIALPFVHGQTTRPANPDEWTSYGLTPGETRYSPLNLINASNVSRLGLKWSYDLGVGGGNGLPSRLQVPTWPPGRMRIAPLQGWSVRG